MSKKDRSSNQLFNNIAPAVVTSVIYSLEEQHHHNLNLTLFTALPDMEKNENSIQVRLEVILKGQFKFGQVRTGQVSERG